MTFAEAARIMMSGGSKVIQPIAIAQYGDYEIKAPEGVAGYNPIHVNLKDRYQAGYTDGWMKCFLNIKTITITKNGRYNAKSENLEGYNPVVVDVPDRYDEGFQAGYTEGDNDGREAQKKICDEEKAILIEEIDRQEKEIEELKKKQGYTFPEGTSYEDIYQFVGDDTVTDKTLGYYIQTTYTPYPGDRERILTGVYNTNGEMVAKLWGINAPIKKWKVINVNVLTDGNYTVSYTWGNGKDSDSGYCSYLVGFGASDHQINVQSN